MAGVSGWITAAGRISQWIRTSTVGEIKAAATTLFHVRLTTVAGIIARPMCEAEFSWRDSGASLHVAKATAGDRTAGVSGSIMAAAPISP
jgi:hypothetical protein